MKTLHALQRELTGTRPRRPGVDEQFSIRSSGNHLKLPASKWRNWLVAAVAALLIVANAPAQTVPSGSVLIVYDSTGDYGWIGGMHARLLANLLGHFDLPYVIKPVEGYHAGDMEAARATFYLGTVYDNPLPAEFKADVMTTTKTLCWFRYNLWQVAGADFTAKFGYQFDDLDWSGYSNIVYKGESFLKNQLDLELGKVTVVDTNMVSVPAAAVMTNTNGATIASIPYVTHSGKLWYVADVPFEYMSEEDRYLVFADLLHDILGINHPESHRAIIRLEDVAPTMYTPAVLRQTADLLKSNNIPYAIALVPVYTDPLGTYNSGAPVTHRLADASDTNSTKFASAIRYMIANGAQLIIHGYTHQYNSTANPYNGCTGDDFEFFRETFNTNTADAYDLALYGAVPEDSQAWALGRMKAAKAELAQVGFSSVAWEFPHYAASALDSQIAATNFPATMHRVLYFDDSGHAEGQMFPYIINRDIYGQKIIPENLGNIEPTVWQNYPARSAADMIRTAKKNLVVRDGWASGYFHPFYDLTNLQTLITGVKALGYTYVQVSASEPPSITTQPASRTNSAGTTANFNVAAVGAAAMNYQWRFNSAALPGRTNAALSLTNVQATNAGNYDVVVSNSFGAVTSFPAKLTVAAVAPTITTQPQSQTVRTNQPVTFSVGANGSATLRYQWRFNGAGISKATNSTYSIASVKTANAGNYSVVVSNTVGSVTSANAKLTVR